MNVIGVNTTSSTLSWIMSLPFSIELQVMEADGNITALPIDTFVDTSYVSNQWITSTTKNHIRIRGNVVNDKKAKVIRAKLKT